MPLGRITIVDGHVHIYTCFSLPGLLEAAKSNFSMAARRNGASEHVGVLLLAEKQGDHWYQALRSASQGDERYGDWIVGPLAGDRCTLSAERKTGELLLIVAGRQMVTEEGLEVLGLATDALFDDGQPIQALVQAILDKSGLPVVPWAVGKWTGRRRRVVERLLASDLASKLCLGDNGGRPAFWRHVSLFRQAARGGVKILPGTDPLPLPSEEEQVGSFGFVIRDKLSDACPSEHLRELLLNPGTAVHPYGRLEGAFRFFGNQARIRLQREH